MKYVQARAVQDVCLEYIILTLDLETGFPENLWAPNSGG